MGMQTMKDGDPVELPLKSYPKAIPKTLVLDEGAVGLALGPCQHWHLDHETTSVLSKYSYAYDPVRLCPI